MALLYEEAQPATVRCVAAGTLWAVERRLFDAKLRRPASPPDAQLLAFLSTAPLLSKLSHVRLEQLARGARQVSAAPAERIVAAGERATEIYVVRM